MNQQAALILNRLDTLGAWHRLVPLRELQRRMNPNKPPLWRQALELLVRKRCVTVVPGPRRQQLICLVEILDYLQARTIIEKPRRRRHPGRHTEWFYREILAKDADEGGPLQEGIGGARSGGRDMAEDLATG